MPGHSPTTSCTFAQFNSLNGYFVHLVMMTQNNPGWQQTYDNWIMNMWTHYNGTGQNAGCNWFINRITLWSGQIVNLNPSGYNYALKVAKIGWAKRMLTLCC